MATWTSAPPCPPHDDRAATKPRVPTIIAAVSCALVLVVLTRWPVARTVPLETDEFGFLEDVTAQWFPMHHTLFKTLARDRTDRGRLLSRLHHSRHHRQRVSACERVVVAAPSSVPTSRRRRP